MLFITSNNALSDCDKAYQCERGLSPGCGQHAVSGQGVRFDSLDILMTFLGRVLNTGDTAFLEEVRHDGEV